MTIADQFPEPPAHLSPSARQWWQTAVETYVFQEHHLRLLQLLCEAWDRAQSARAQLDAEGLTVPGREGGLRAHPCIAIERDSRLAVARLDATPRRERRSEQFEEEERELHDRLGLSTEHFCSIVSVLDRERDPCRGPEYQATTDWHTCRRVRLELLAALRLAALEGSARGPPMGPTERAGRGGRTRG